MMCLKLQIKGVVEFYNVKKKIMKPWECMKQGYSGAGAGAGSDIFKSCRVWSDFYKIYIFIYLMHICQQKHVEWWINDKQHKNMD